MGYQTLMNQALRQFLAGGARPVTEADLRRVLREEIAQYRPEGSHHDDDEQ